MSFLRNVWQTTFETFPILLVNGLAKGIIGHHLPLIIFGTDQTFMPVQGNQLKNNRIGEYPFFNNQTAGNAVIKDSVNLSMRLIVPCQDLASMLVKQAIINELVIMLDEHEYLGGTYTILTPYHNYTDCVLTSLTCIDDTDSKQVGIIYQFDFRKVIITTDDASGAYNALMTKLDTGMGFDTTPGWQSAAKELFGL